MDNLNSPTLPTLSGNRDVAITTPANGDVFAYDNGSGKWINLTLAGAGIAAASHTHTASQITDFTEAVQDVVGALIGDSSSVDVTYNDGANTFTIAVLPGGVDHNSLANLTSGDPHTQYLKTDGSRALTGDLSAGSHKITNLATPTASTDAATKAYADSVGGSGGGSRFWMEPAVCRTIGNVNLSGGGIANGTTHDGVTVSTGQRILVPDQTNPMENGPYIVPASGAATRATDLASGVVADSAAIIVARGTLYHDVAYIQTANGCTVGTDAQTWQELRSSGFVYGAVSTNLLHNSSFAVSQRADFSSVVSVSDDNYCLDRWNALSEYFAEGIQRATGTAARYAMYVKNNSGLSKRVGVSQILEELDSVPLRGRPVTLKTRIKCEEAKNCRIAVLEWTGTANSVTSDVVNSWSNGTFTAGNFFNSTTLTVTGTQQIACAANTWTSVSLTVTLGSSVNNVIVMIWSEDQLSDTKGIYIECPQLNDGGNAGDYVPRPICEELLLCQRYFFSVTGARFHGVLMDSQNIVGTYVRTPVPMRTTPTMSVTGSPTWIAGSPGATQVAAYGIGATTGYASISGSLTVNAYSYDVWTFILWFVAGTNFAGGGGSAGSSYQMLTGSSVRISLDSDL